MGTLLTWTNRNKTPVLTKIYRSTSPITESNLPQPIATIEDNAVTKYNDSSATEDYHYLISFYNGKKEVFGNPIVTSHGSDTGIGPSELQSGSLALGYYGLVNMPHYQTLQQMCGLTTTTVNASMEQAQFHKVIRNGKVLILPDSYIGNFNYQTLFNLGLVHGDGLDHTYNGTTVKQDTTINLSGYTYRVRLMSGISDVQSEIDYYISQNSSIIAGFSDTADATKTNSATLHNPYFKNEFDDIYYSFTDVAESGSTFKSQNIVTFPEAVFTSGHNQRILVKDGNPSLIKQLIRYGANRLTQGTGTIIVGNQGSMVMSSVIAGYWVPVFELVQDNLI